MQDAHLAETRQSLRPIRSEHQQPTRSSTIRRSCKLLCAPEWVLSSGVSMSHPWLFPHATSSMSISSFTFLSYHTTRTLSTSSVSPGSPSRQAAPSRITLAWKPAEWRKPGQDNSHNLWAQRTCDRLKDRSSCWRSTSIKWCDGKFWRRRSPCSCHRRSGGIWRN